MKQSVYDQLIDIALDTKDFRWVRELYNEKVNGKPIEEKHNEELNDFLSFKFTSSYNSFDYFELKFELLSDEDSNKFFSLHELIDKKVKLTVQKEDSYIEIIGTIYDLELKYKSITFKLPKSNKKEMAEMYNFYEEKIKLSFKLIS